MTATLLDEELGAGETERADVDCSGEDSSTELVIDIGCSDEVANTVIGSLETTEVDMAILLLDKSDAGELVVIAAVGTSVGAEAV